MSSPLSVLMCLTWVSHTRSVSSSIFLFACAGGTGLKSPAGVSLVTCSFYKNHFIKLDNAIHNPTRQSTYNLWRVSIRLCPPLPAERPSSSGYLKFQSDTWSSDKWSEEGPIKLISEKPSHFFFFSNFFGFQSWVTSGVHLPHLETTARESLLTK